MANLLLDPGFESPVLSADSNPFSPPTGTPWTFAGFSGIAVTGGTYLGGLTPPSGNQCLYLQKSGSTAGSVAQAVTVPSNGNYLLAFTAACKSGQSADILIKVGGTTVAKVRPLAGVFQVYAVNLALTAGATTVSFAVVNPDGSAVTSATDNSAFLDQLNLDLGGTGASTTGSIGGLFVAANDSHWVGSDLGFYTIPGSNDMGTNSQGNGNRIGFCDSSTLSGLFDVGPSTWRLAYRIDDLGWVYATQNTVINLTGLDPTIAHIFEFEVATLTGSGDTWTPAGGGGPPPFAFRIQGIQLDGNAVLLPTTPRPFRVLCPTNSFGAGTYARGQTADPRGLGDSTCSFVAYLKRAINAEVSARSSPGQGLTRGGVNDSWPALPSTYTNWYSGRSMLTGGLFPTPPDLVVLEIGNNDGTASAGTVTAAAEGVYNGLLAAGAKGIVQLDTPFAGNSVDPALAAAIAAVDSPKIAPILPASVVNFVALTTATPALASGGHPTAAFHQEYFGPALANYILAHGFLSQTPASTDPGIAHVQAGITYQANGANLTGTYDPVTGNYTDPGIAHVQSATTYKFAGANLTGTLAVSGTSTDPGITHVQAGITYQINGTSLTGTYDPITGRYSDPGAANVLTGHSYLYAGSTVNGSASAGSGGSGLTSQQVQDACTASIVAAGLATASAVAALSSGGGLFGRAIVGAVSGPVSFQVIFTDAAPSSAASLVGLECCLTSGASILAKQQITAATPVGGSTFALAFAVPFATAPAQGDPALIG